MNLIIRVAPEMTKALNTSKLVKKKVEVRRNGKVVEQMRWVRPDQAGAPAAGASTPKAPASKPKPATRLDAKGRPVQPKLGIPRDDAEDPRGAKHGYGMHNIEKGDSIEFTAGGEKLRGVIVDDSRHDGVIVQTPSGQKHPVPWKDITNFSGAPKEKKPDQAPAKKPDAAPAPAASAADTKGRDPVPPEKFTAGEWKKDHDDANANSAAILDEMEKAFPGAKEAVKKTEARLKNLEQAISNHRVSGQDAGAIYSPERTALHNKIMDKFMSPEKMKAAMPASGEKPVFIMLGGRGGSGKSWFEGKVYDEHSAIVLDADAIKGELPEYEGFNAAQVHEESSDILEKMIHRARALGLNVVLDATMKTAKSALAKVDGFRNQGYSIEAHYMHLPRQEAAKRAVGRFMGKTKRYVPVDVVLSNVSNEDSFDQVKKLADAWSFRDNNVAQGQDPVLISAMGKGRFAKFMKSLWDALAKSVNYQINYKRRDEMDKKSKGKNLVGPVTPETFDRFDEYDCRPDTPEDKVDPALRARIEEDRKALGIDGK